MDCQKCKKVLSKKGSHFQCQGQCKGTFHRSCVKGLAADLKAGISRIYCNNCTDEDDSVNDDQEDDARYHDKILKDIQKNVNIIPCLIKQLECIKNSMCLLSEKYDTLLAEHEKSKDKIRKLEKTVENINNKCVYVEKCNTALEQKLHDYEQLTRKQNIEIVGLEAMPDENVTEIVSKLGKMINVSDDNIEWVRRNQPRKQGISSASIIVGFKASGTKSRDAWLAERHKLSDITSDKITGGIKKSKVYINEDLTKSTRTLLWFTKKVLRHHYKYIWVSNGKILVKKMDGNKTSWVRSEKDIFDLLKKKD
ncbi:uncharacterized protein LOC106713295 [Papilio machaon]|uniref:uncharacterized protein LOC106713295 n=1 Tax=Papilio machaon TaxID=76193 RepID=UPI001E66336C|nr:uncharacterized protein LOC106713295 [Papilio machaon]